MADSMKEEQVQRNDESFAGLWEEIVWRGLVQVSTDPQKLKNILNGSAITFYCGFDPTAGSLHLGHLVQLLLMRRLQLAGHKPLALVGGSTGLIGDPRSNKERQMVSKEQVDFWAKKLKAQIDLVISQDQPVTIVDNLDWTAPLSAIDFLRDIGKYFRVGTMVKKEIVSTRLNSEEGISYTEFSYQILQGLDFLELYRRHACVLQFGGSDQWGNLTSGTELIRKVEGVGVHALGTPLITNSDGTKFGKSEGNAIWLDPELTSPYEFYQFWLNTDDADVCDRLKIFTFRTRAEIEDLIARSAEHPHKRLAQGLLARDVTALVHGEAATNQAVMASAAMFGGAPLEELDRALLQGVLRELPHVTVPWGEGQWGVVELFVRSGLVSSNSAARRNIQEGGAQMNNRKIDDVTTIVQAEELLHGQYLVLSKGKRARAVVEFERSST